MDHISELFNQGYTVLPSLISEETCDTLTKYLDRNFNEDLPYNYIKGHYQIHLPKKAEDFPEEIVFNKKIHEILRDVMGPSYYMYSYTCNANIASKNQPFHIDCTHYHPLDTVRRFGSPGPPFQIIVNTYLQDTDESNGSLEIVPKSHVNTYFESDEEGRIEEKYIGETKRCNLPKGSVIIRDKRTWHRGTMNLKDKTRYMTSTSYSMGWYKLENRLQFNKDSEEFFYDSPFSCWNLDFNVFD